MNARHRGSAFPVSNLFGPNRWAREAASAELRPTWSSTFSSWRTRSVLSVCHAGPSAPGIRPDAGPPAGAVIVHPSRSVIRPASPVGRHGRRLGHLMTPAHVDGDAEQ